MNSSYLNINSIQSIGFVSNNFVGLFTMIHDLVISDLNLRELGLINLTMVFNDAKLRLQIQVYYLISYPSNSYLSYPGYVFQS